MGMYDEVRFKCPSCEAPIAVQSKSGDCMFRRHRASNVPVSIAVGVEGEFVKCECGASWQVEFARLVKPTAPARAALRLVEFVEADDDDEEGWDNDV